MKSNKNKSRSKSSKRGGRRPNQQNQLKRLLGNSPDTSRVLIGSDLKHNFIVPPSRPLPGARFTTRQIAATFNTQSGLSTVGSGSYAATLVSNSSTPTLASIGFRLDDLTQVTTFSALFDQYRFEKIRLHIKARSNALAVQNTASPNAAVPTAYIVVDRDDATAPSLVSDLWQYDNVASFNGREDCIIDLIPNVTPAVFSSGAFSGYSSMPSDSTWIDIANTGVPMYGVKIAVAGLTLSTTSTWTWDIIPEYVISFKNTR